MGVPYHILALLFNQITAALSSLPTNYIPLSNVASSRNFLPHTHPLKETPHRSVRLTISVEPGSGPAPVPCLASVTVSPLLSLDTVTSPPTPPPMFKKSKIPFPEVLNPTASNSLPQLPFTDNLLTIVENPLQSDIPRALAPSLPCIENNLSLVGFRGAGLLSRLNPASSKEIETRKAPEPKIETPFKTPNVQGQILDEQANYVNSEGNPHQKLFNHPHFNMQKNKSLFKRVDDLNINTENNNIIEEHVFGGSNLVLEKPYPKSNPDVSFPTISAANTQVRDECTNQGYKPLFNKISRLNIKTEANDFEFPLNSFTTQASSQNEKGAFNEPLTTLLSNKHLSPNQKMPHYNPQISSSVLSRLQTSVIESIDNKIETKSISNLKLDGLDVNSNKLLNENAFPHPKETLSFDSFNQVERRTMHSDNPDRDRSSLGAISEPCILKNNNNNLYEPAAKISPCLPNSRQTYSTPSLVDEISDVNTFIGNNFMCPENVHGEANFQLLKSDVMPPVPLNSQTIESKRCIVKSPPSSNMFLKNRDKITLPSFSNEANPKLFPLPIQTCPFSPNQIISNSNILPPKSGFSTIFPSLEESIVVWQREISRRARWSCPGSGRAPTDSIRSLYIW